MSKINILFFLTFQYVVFPSKESAVKEGDITAGDVTISIVSFVRKCVTFLRRILLFFFSILFFDCI